MKTYTAGIGWRNGDDQPTGGRHRLTTSETDGSAVAGANLHTNLRREPHQEVASERRHAATPTRPLQPVGASTGNRMLLDAYLLDLLD